MIRDRLYRLLRQSVRSRQKAQQTEPLALRNLKEEYMLAAEDETRYLLNHLKAIPGLWDDMCTATHEGKPQCFPKVIDIARQAGVIENDPELIEIARNSRPSGKHHMEFDGGLATSKSFVVYSAHHEAAGAIDLSIHESNIMHTIIWALEGQLFLRE
jgi:hypothetical protein